MRPLDILAWHFCISLDFPCASDLHMHLFDAGKKYSR